MSIFLQQVFSLLVGNPGSLAYNLVLAFSLLAALLATLNQWRGIPAAQDSRPAAQDSRPAVQADRLARRMLLGLSLLLACRMTLFIGAGLVWQGAFTAGQLLPPLERGVDLLSLLIIAWLWAFPEANRAADTATALLGCSIVALSVLGVLANLEAGAGGEFNGSTADRYAQLAGVALAGLGMALLAARRPAGWTTGMATLATLGGGHLLQILIPFHGDYPGAVRLSQIIAYPLLIALPGRLAVGASTSSTAQTPLQSEQEEAIDPRVQRLALEWAKASDPRQAGEMLSATLAQAVLADVCLLLWPPDAQGRAAARYGYDAIHRLAVPDLMMEAGALPVLSTAFAQGRALRLPGNSTAPDLRELARALDLKRAGPLLSAPIRSEDDRPVVQVVMLSPFTGRKWTLEDQERLSTIAKPLAHILQRNQQMAEMEAALAQARQDLQSTQERMVKAESDRSNLIEMVSVLQENELEPAAQDGGTGAVGADETTRTPVDDFAVTGGAVTGGAVTGGDKANLDGASGNRVEGETGA